MYCQKLTTKSGRPLNIGTGTGTKWQWLKKARPEEEQGTLAHELVDQLSLAIDNGYYHLDTANVYTTEAEVGEAVKVSGKPREDFFITTKYGPFTVVGLKPPATATESIDAALKSIGSDYVDLFLIHSPFIDDDSHYTIESLWQEVVAIKKAGKARYIGVSNFTVDLLKRCQAVSEPEDHPAVNQIEFHPYLQNQSPGIVEFCHENGILVEGFCPLAPLFRLDADPKLKDVDGPIKALAAELAAKYNKTDAQILLRYTMHKGVLPISTSSKVDRIKQSLESYDFELSDEDVEKIDTVGKSFHYRVFFSEFFDK